MSTDFSCSQIVGCGSGNNSTIIINSRIGNVPRLQSADDLDELEDRIAERIFQKLIAHFHDCDRCRSKILPPA